MSFGNCSWLFKAVGSAAVELLVTLPTACLSPFQRGGSYFAAEQVRLHWSEVATSWHLPRQSVLCLLSLGLPRAAAHRIAVHHVQGWPLGVPEAGLGARSPAGSVWSAHARFACVSGQALNCKSSRQQKEECKATAQLLFSFCPYLFLEHFFSPLTASWRNNFLHNLIRGNILRFGGVLILFV